MDETWAAEHANAVVTLPMKPIVYTGSAYGKVLILIESFVGLTAVAGGIGLMATNGLGMPIASLKGSVFSSYHMPGLILVFAVGLVNAAAAVLTAARKPEAVFASAAAGFSLLIWTFMEVYLIKQSYFLQAVYFILAITILISNYFLIYFSIRTVKK